MSNIFVSGMTIENPTTKEIVKLTPEMVTKIMYQIKIQNGRNMIEN